MTYLLISTVGIDRDLLDSIAAEAEVIFLDSTENIQERITEILGNYSNLSNVHFFLTKRDGDRSNIELNRITEKGLEIDRDRLSSWLQGQSLLGLRQSFAEDATIFFHEFNPQTKTFETLQELAIADSLEALEARHNSLKSEELNNSLNTRLALEDSNEREHSMVTTDLDDNLSTTSQILFIDSQVEDYQTLATGVIPGTEVIILDADKDSIKQISAVLSQRPQVASIHIVSHGSPGCLYLGNSQLNLHNIESYASDLQSWFSPSILSVRRKAQWSESVPSDLAISQSPSLLLYGCNVAAGDAGAEFITKLHRITGAEIAASTTPTGNSAKGGNWNLEVTTGRFAVSLVFEQETLDNYSFVMPVFINDYYGIFTPNGGTANQLRTIDLSTGSSTVVTNSTTLFTTNALSRGANTGRLYYIENVADNARVAYYNTLTGTHTQVGTTGVTGVTFVKMAQAQDGTIWAAGGNNQLYTINPGTGAATLRYTMGFSATAASGDIAFDPNNANVLYVTRGATTTSNDSSTNDATIDLYRITLNPTDFGNSTTSLVGNTGQSGTTSGSLAFGNNGLLYASSNGNLIRIDTGTGAGTVVATGVFSATNGSASDFATLPIAQTNTANAPTANNDSYEVVRNGSIDVKTTTNGILTNDTDPNSDTLIILGVTQGTNGTVTFNDSQTPFDSSDDTVTYTPTANFTGTDTFTYTVGDGKGGYSTATVTVKVNAPPAIDLDSNNSSGTTGNNYQNKFSFNGSAVVIADTDTTITDADDTNIESATITLTNRPNGTSESLSVLGTLPTGITASAYNSSTGVITLTGSATRANYQTAINQIVYNNTALTGRLSGNRTINVVVNDGNTNSNTATTTVSVTLTDNSVPAIDLDSSNNSAGANYQTSFTEGTAVAIADTDTTITDADDTNIESATITLTNAQASDLLAAGTLPTGITASAYNPATGVITLTGSASRANYQTAIEAITFNNTSDNPSTTARSVSVVVNDGNNNSNTATTTINVSAVNDAPVIDLDANNSSGTTGNNYQNKFSFNGSAVAIADTDTTITDADDTNIESATITLTNRPNGTSESLSVLGTLPTGITASAYNSSTGVITLTGSATRANYQTAINQIVYNNTALTGRLSGNRTINVVVNDGNTNSNTATTTVSVTLTDNSVPAIDLDSSNSSGATGNNYQTTFTENVAAVAIADSDTTITDLDDTNIESATITLTNAQASDFLAAGTLPAGITASTYNSATGVITLTGSTTLANYQTAIRAITFSNTSDNPSTTPRSVSVVVNDGNNNSNTATTTINVSAVNDAPVLDLDANDSSTATGVNYQTSFTENGTAVAIADSDISISDLDNSNIASATITLTNALSGDRFLVGGTAVSNGSSGTVNGINYTVTASGGQIGIALSGSATLANYQTAIGAITFENPSDNTSTTARSVSVVVNDGNSNSNTATTTINVNAVNDAPVLDLDANNSSTATGANYQNQFNFNGSPVAIADSDTTITDLDNTNITSATITLTNRPNLINESLSVLGTLPTGITASVYNPATGVITLSGSATLANYQTAIAQIAYNNTATILKDYSDRSISVVVSDGTANSNTATTTIKVNDPPVIDLDGDNSSTATGANYQTTFTENGTAVSIGDTDTTITDANNSNIASATITLTNAQASDLLAAGTLPAGITASAYDSATGVITLSGSATLANYQTAIRAITFNNTSNNPSTTPRSVAVVVNDGNNSNTAISTINVIPAIKGTNSSEALTGSPGNDVMIGYKGQDTLTGGGGNDSFYFNETSDGVDIITDFNPNGDLLDFRDIIDGELSGVNFTTNPFDNGYVEAVSFGSHTMIQVDFNPADSLYNKDVVLLKDVTYSTISASDFIFS